MKDVCMNFPASLRRAFALLLPLFLAPLMPCMAQQPSATPLTTKPAPPASAPKSQPAPSVTFDTLLAADSYAIYGEVRGLGQYLNSKEVTELTTPLGLPGGAPPE